MLVNCDIGERGADHPIDLALIREIDIANIACGGHAGDRHSVATFAGLAQEQSIRVSAHLSYPDHSNFGRRSLAIPFEQLSTSLDEQLALLPEVTLVKFHGALYNDACMNKSLAHNLTEWLLRNGITTVLTLPHGELHHACQRSGITVWKEAFAERRYILTPEGVPILSPRSKPWASIDDLTSACNQARSISKEHKLPIVTGENAGALDITYVPYHAETICVHSDSPLSLELARTLREMMYE